MNLETGNLHGRSVESGNKRLNGGACAESDDRSSHHCCEGMRIFFLRNARTESLVHRLFRCSPHTADELTRWTWRGSESRRGFWLVREGYRGSRQTGRQLRIRREFL